VIQLFRTFERGIKIMSAQNLYNINEDQG
jgi:hypothetical protein